MAITVEVSSPFMKRKDGLEKYTNKYNYFLYLGFTVSVISAIFQGLFFIQFTTLNNLIYQEQNSIELNIFWYATVLLVIVIITNIINEFLLNNYIKKSSAYLKKQFIDHLFKTEALIGEEGLEQYITMINLELEKIESSYFVSKYKTITNYINLLFGIIVMIYIDYKILLFIILFIIISISVISTMMSFIDKKFNDMEKAVEDSYLKVKELIKAFWLIKANSIEEKAIHDFKEDAVNFEGKNAKFSLFTNALITTTTQTLLSLILFIGITYISLEIKSGNMEFANFAIVVMALMWLIMPFLDEQNNQNQKKIGEIALDKIVEFFKKQEYKTLEFPSNFKSIKINNLKLKNQDIEINYPNININANDKIIITGASGCGKSTLLKALSKRKDLYEGEILVNDASIKDIKRSYYYEKLAYLSQEVFLFNDTILNNIIMKQDFDQEKLEKVMKLACVDSIISKKENGLNYELLNNGNNLSGGEKARIALARILYLDKSVILLDEPFANLDFDTYNEIENNILKLEDKTIICVSHISESVAKYLKNIKL